MQKYYSLNNWAGNFLFQICITGSVVYLRPMFEVIGLRGDQKKELASIPLSMQSSFLQKDWFLGAMALIVILAGVGIYYKRRVDIAQLRKRQETQLEERTYDLKLLAQSLRSKKEQLERINIIVKSINSETNFISFLNTILEQFTVMKGVERARVLVLDKDSGHFGYKVAKGWDMANLMDDLSTTLAAFHADMQDHMNELTLVAMTEFGRRADENGSAGTDHGHGSCMFAMGGNIAGGQVITDWTDNELLHPDLLYRGDSLDVKIDYRDIVSEILQNRLNNTALSTVFPNYTPTFQGITL